MRSRIIRRSRALATSASATGIFSVACSNVSLRRASRPRLVGGEGFAVDASLIQADANKHAKLTYKPTGIVYALDAPLASLTSTA